MGFCFVVCICMHMCVHVSVCWLDRIRKRGGGGVGEREKKIERISRSSAESENARERRGVAVQSDAWRLNLFLTELHQC